MLQRSVLTFNHQNMKQKKVLYHVLWEHLNCGYRTKACQNQKVMLESCIFSGFKTSLAMGLISGRSFQNPSYQTKAMMGSWDSLNLQTGFTCFLVHKSEACEESSAPGFWSQLKNMGILQRSKVRTKEIQLVLDIAKNRTFITWFYTRGSHKAGCISETLGSELEAQIWRLQLLRVLG